MAPELSLHVVARDCSVLASLIRELAGSVVRVMRYSTLPPVRALHRDDALVICNDDLSRPFDRLQLQAVLHDHSVWFAYTDGTVPAPLLVAARCPNVHLMLCESLDRAAAMRPLATAVVQHLAGPGPDHIERLVLAKEPVLASVRALVHTICERPWQVRHPTDLAAAGGWSLRQVRRMLEPLGFTRVEHFITYVRCVACKQLIAQRSMSRRVAEHLTGIVDRSNLRRQLDRARHGSPRASACGPTRLGALAFVTCVLSAVACRDKAASQAAASETPASGPDSTIALPVVGAVVRRGDLVLSIRTTGQVRAERQVSLKGETQGTVHAVLVRPGERVDSGEVLVRLDPRPFDLAVREAESQVADATVRYRDILIGEDTTASTPEALERRENARLRAGLDGAEARFERARLDRELAVLQAPFAGTMDQVQVVVGQRLAAGDPIVTLVDLGSLIVEASVLEHDLPLLRRGATAAVSLAASERSFPGRVIAVLPLVDTTTRAGRVLVRVRTSDGILRPGMYADVELEATRIPNRVLVPAAAVIERDGRPLVFRCHAGRAEWVYVRPGRSNGHETEVLPDSTTGRPAVAAGDTVLVEGHLTLTHDAPVRLRFPEEASPIP